MHRIWGIREVIRTIATHLDSDTSISHLAQVSRICFECAAPVLWNELEDGDLENAFRLLFVNWGQHATSLTTPSSCKRFIEYTSHIHYLRFKGNHNWTADSHSYLAARIQVAAGLLSDKKKSWFPHLRQLHIADPSRAEGLVSALHFVVPSLTELHLKLPYPDKQHVSHTWNLVVATLLHRACKNLPGLRALSLTGLALSLHQDCQARLIPLLSERQPCSLRLSIVTFNNSIAEAASKMPSLQRLSLEERDEIEADSPVELSKCSRAAPLVSRRFSALKELLVRGRPTAVESVLRSIDASLDHLEIVLLSDHEEDPEQVTEQHYLNIANLVAERFPHLTNFTFRAELAAEDTHLKFSYLKPLRRCSDITRLDVSSKHYDLEIDDEDIHALTQSWHSLQHLSLTDESNGDVHPGMKRLSWRSFVSLREHCPNLVGITLSSFDASQPLPFPLVSSGPPLSLSILVSPYLPDHFAYKVALFLSSLWPEISIQCGVKSKEWNMMKFLNDFTIDRSDWIRLKEEKQASLSNL
ncbi:hypothetical protein CALVIDRAFT_596715 [Calocera viscosa TUFC12733]|uniref:F-box domain-containing protein n=1 Tax=Calocera viscosa (strain TUFC12733) TaxID=1330018 RepID=A0A167PBF8_CALVF|nr:hypothetical protein CALVIDRAFT_596715 [Calocera viscosa TUFC12733]